MMAIDASCRITQGPALGLRTDCTCTSNPGPSKFPAFANWTSALSRVPSQTARRSRERTFGFIQAAESVSKVSHESRVGSGQNGQDCGNGTSNGSVNGQSRGSENKQSNGSVNGKSDGRENGSSNGNGNTKKEFDGVVRRQSRSAYQRVEWWRIDERPVLQTSSEAGGSQATDEVIERIAGPRRRTVGWMREAHGEESDGEELWTWKASTQTLHLNGNAMHKRLESESSWVEEASVETQVEVSENGAVANGYLRESVVVESVAGSVNGKSVNENILSEGHANEGSVNGESVNGRSATRASENGVASRVGKLLMGAHTGSVRAGSANAGSVIGAYRGENGYGATHVVVAQVENGRSKQKLLETGRGRSSEAVSARDSEVEAPLERKSKKGERKKKDGAANLEKKKNKLGKKKGKKAGKELGREKSEEGVHVVDETGARVRMYPGPGYVDRMQSQKLAVLSSPTDTVRHRTDKLSSGGVKTGGDARPSADNLEERLQDLRRKATEHKDRHQGESGTLVVPTRQPILVLMRHGESMWNQLKLFTGDVDIPLTEKGVMEALSGGRTIKDVDFDIVFTSRLLRAKQTAMLALTQNSSHVVPVLVRGGYHGEGRIGDGNRLRLREAAMYALDKAACKTVPVYAHSALNERCYGDLQGLNKEEAAREFGKEMVQKWRRSNDTSPPGGESLVDTAQRARKYYVNVIEPRLAEGKNVLVVTHGNVMRGLIAYLASLEQEEMLTLEIATAFPYAYAFSRESGDYAQCCLMKPMEDFITGEPLEDKPMGLASVLKKKNFDSLI